MLQQVPLAWNLEEFAFDIPSGIIPKEEKKDLQANVHKIILSLDNLSSQVVEWLKNLEGDMEIYMASKEYIKRMESKRPIDVESYVPLSIITDPEEEYVPEYIVPHVPGV